MKKQILMSVAIIATTSLCNAQNQQGKTSESEQQFVFRSSISQPVQNRSAVPLGPNDYDISTFSLSGGFTVGGTGADYSNLTGPDGLFNALNLSTVSGNLTVYIAGNLTEPGTVALNQFLEEPAGSNFSLTIVPVDGSEKLISGNVSGGMIKFNGADRVTVDGSYGGSGRYLRFRNENSSGPVFTFLNDASYNNITNSIIEGGNTATTSGVILFGTTTLNDGNDYNVISGNILRDRSDVTGIPYNLVYSAGTSLHENSDNTIMNNEIFNFSNYGINIGSAGNGRRWTVTGNNFYNNLASPMTTRQYSVYINTGNAFSGHVVNNNYIGGSDVNCGGSVWINSGGDRFYGIFVYAGASEVNKIQGNIIRNISMTSVVRTDFWGIYTVQNGLFDISGNTIGNASGPASINISGSGNVYGILGWNSSPTPSTIQNNVVCGISLNRTTSGYLNPNSFYGIWSLGLNNVTNNTVGNPDEAGSITIADSRSASGIYSNSPGTISNNIVANILRTNPDAGTTRGLYIAGATAVRRVEANTVINLGAVSSPALTGWVEGILINVYPTTIANNMISLGHGTENNIQYHGIYYYYPDYPDLMPDVYFYNNSIRIGGTCTGDKSSYSFYKGGKGSITNKDNIYTNFRINGPGGTGKHSIYKVENISNPFISDYNDLYTTTGLFAIWDITDIIDLEEWQSVTGNDLHSSPADPGFYSETDLRACSWELDGTGIAIPGITLDLTGATRGDPPDMGAYEFTLPVASITTGTPDEFCNGEWLTAHSSTTEGSFEWSTGETTQSIFLNSAEDAAGDYSVYVYDENGCRSVLPATYDFQPEELASSYTLLGFTEAQVGENNTVLNGSVGLTGAALTAHVKKNARVNGPGSFVKSEFINAHPTAIIREKIFEPTAVVLPTMHYNTTSGPFSNVFVPDNTVITIPQDNINLNIGKNCSVTLAGSVFGNIQVNRGTTLTFESSLIDINSLKTLPGTANAPVTIAFADDASVRVKSSIDMDVYSVMNPDLKKVIFYIGAEGIVGGQLKVKATGGVFNGSAFVPTGQIQVITDGLPAAPALMTGKFIADKILSTGKHVIWNWSDCSGLELMSGKDPSIMPPSTDQSGSDNALLIYPNPNNGQFRASITIPGEETFRCLVFNNIGQLVREMPDIKVNGSTECLIDLRPMPEGIYTVIFQSNGHHLVKKVMVNLSRF